MAVPPACGTYFKNYERSQSDKMVPLLVSFLIFCCCQFVPSNGKEWNFHVLKGIKAPVRTQVAERHVLTSLWPLLGITARTAPHHSHHPSTSFSVQCHLFFFELKVKLPVLKFLVFFRSMRCFMDISIFIPYKCNNSSKMSRVSPITIGDTRDILEFALSPIVTKGSHTDT